MTALEVYGLSKNYPLSNLYVSMLDCMGIEVPRFGDSTDLDSKIHVVAALVKDLLRQLLRHSYIDTEAMRVSHTRRTA